MTAAAAAGIPVELRTLWITRNICADRPEFPKFTFGHLAGTKFQTVEFLRRAGGRIAGKHRVE